MSKHGGGRRGTSPSPPAQAGDPLLDDGLRRLRPDVGAGPAPTKPLKRASTEACIQGATLESTKLVRRHSLCHVSMAAHSRGHDFDLTDLKPMKQRLKLKRQSSFLELGAEMAPTPGKIQHLMVRAQTRTSFLAINEETKEEKGQGPPTYLLSAAMAIILNVLSVLPYVKILATDPGSPIFIAFVTHLFVVAVNLHKAPKLVMNRKLPMYYHVAFVAIAYLFNLLKGDSFSRLPTAVAMVMMNLQMLVGMVVQGLVFRQQFSLPQISGCAIVTLGVIMAGISSRKPSAASSSSSTADTDQSSNFMVGSVELLGALTAVVFLSALTKKAFAKYGECVDEQLFFQHLFGIPLFFIGSQWEKIGPRINDWARGGDFILVGMLLSNLAFTFAGSKARVTFIGRAPNALLVQLVETVTKFISLFATALLNSPPLPPIGFWAGSGTLVLGTLQFLTASDAPERDDESSDDDDE